MSHLSWNDFINKYQGTKTLAVIALNMPNKKGMNSAGAIVDAPYMLFKKNCQLHLKGDWAIHQTSIKKNVFIMVLIEDIADLTFLDKNLHPVGKVNTFSKVPCTTQIGYRYDLPHRHAFGVALGQLP